MIKLFGTTDTDFSSNGDAVIQPFKAKVHKEDNGKFYLTVEADISACRLLGEFHAQMSTKPYAYNIHQSIT